VRATIHGLPFNLPFNLLSELIRPIVFHLNALPSNNKMIKTSPLELMTGRKFDHNKHVRNLAFGDYVQAKTPNILSNSMTARTEGCIALGPSGNSQGGWRFLNLSSNHIVIRNQWTILPIPSTAIEHMNHLAKSQRRQLSKDPIYSVGQPLLSNALGELIIDLEGLDPAEFAVPEQINNEINPVQEVLIDEEQIQGEINEMENNNDENNNDEEIFNPKPFEPTHQYSTRSRGPIIQSDQNQNQNQNINQSNIHVESILNISLSKGKKLFGNEKANAAALAEIKQLIEFNVFEPVIFNLLTLEEKMSVIHSSLFLKEKYDAAGIFEKLKGRIVSGGNEQDKSIYSESEISSPTTGKNSQTFFRPFFFLDLF
jgi:hypothetical protein